MSENLFLSNGTKEEKYQTLLPQIKALIDAETDTIANMANMCAAIKFTFNFLWAGFYCVKEDELVLGPFQGPIACTRIARGKGVCGNSWDKKETIIVNDVDAFPGHIACSSLSKSEIVIPIVDLKNNVVAVLDIDSDEYNTFDKTDAHYLTEIVSFLKL